VRRAAAEVFGQELSPRWMPLLIGGLAVAVLAGSGALLWRFVPARVIPASAGSTAATVTVPAASAPATTSAAVAPVADLAATPQAAAAAPGSGATAAAEQRPTTTAPPPTFGQLLAMNRSSTDPDTAFTQLLGLWQATYSPGTTDGCTQALAQGLRCLMQRGSLAQLRMLNRPAILMLSDDAGTASQVVLRALGDDTAQVQIGSQSATISVAELTRYWFGDFVLLWRPGGKDIRDLSAGMRGAPVRQLREQLNRWSGGNNASTSDEYDGSLVKLVEQFQRANRLTVDGIAGIETQVALDAVLAAPDSPLLQPHAAQQASTRGG
jgi:general secretion pathway protein A